VNFFKRVKLSVRSREWPGFEDRDAKDPYARKETNDGQGYDMNRPMDESPDPAGMGSGLGSRFRKDSPTDTQEMDSDYDEQRKDKVDESTHMFLDDAGNRPADKGVDQNFTFQDTDSAFANDALDKGINGRYDPIGVHNMQSYRGVYDRTRSRVKGA
jgi:hypothetical protein